MVPVLGLLHPTHIDHQMRFLSQRALSSGHQYAFGLSVLGGMQPDSAAALVRMLLIITARTGAPRRGPMLPFSNQNLQQQKIIIITCKKRDAVRAVLFQLLLGVVEGAL